MSFQLDNVTNQLRVDDTVASNVSMNLITKGTGNVDLSTGNGLQFRAESSGSAATDFVMVGGSSTGRPFIRSAATSGNIDLAVSSQGTGAVRLYTNFVGQEQARISHTASAVNFVQVTGAATGGAPVIFAQGSDTNIPLSIAPKGTGILYLGGGQTRIGANNANALFVNATVGSVNYLSIIGTQTGVQPALIARGGDANVGLTFGALNDGNIDFFASGDPNAGSGRLQLRVAPIASAVNYLQLNGSVTGQLALIQTAGSDASVGLELRLKGTPVGPGFRISNNNGANVCFAVQTSVGAPANYHQMQPANAGSAPNISIAGTDTNINMNLTTKGTGALNVNTGGGTQFVVYNAASAVNFIGITGAATGADPVVSAQGSDTNIDLVLQPKGTGALQAQATDSTATGGNARGANAVDWQTNRNASNQVASGTYAAMGGGFQNRVDGFGATIAGGAANICSGSFAFVGAGGGNIASQNHSSVVGGYTNTAAGFLNFIGGGFTNSGTANSAVTTQSATMNGTTAVTLSGSNANIRVGQLITGTSINTFPNTYVAAISGTSLTLSQAASGSSTSTLSFFTPHGVVVGGGNNQATGSYSFIGGGGDAGTAANRNVASGDWSTVGGGAKNVASGPASVIVGGGFLGTSIFGNTASADTTFVGGGILNVASNSGAVITGGWQNISNGILSTVGGGRYATARGISGINVFSTTAPIADNWGVSQSSLLIIGRQTTDATATRLTSDTAAASTVNQVILPNNSAYFFRGEVVSGVTGGGNTKGWTIEGVIKRGANAASTALVGTPTVTSSYADAGASSWVIAVTADTTNGGLAVTFTGQAGTTIRTVCQLFTTEMTF